MAKASIKVDVRGLGAFKELLALATIADDLFKKICSSTYSPDKHYLVKKEDIHKADSWRRDFEDLFPSLEEGGEDYLG